MCTPLEKAVEIVGSEAELARLLGITKSAVNQWKKRQIPPRHVMKIEHLTRRKVLRYELRPDLYPREP